MPQQRQQRTPKQVVGSRSPEALELLAKDGDALVGDELAILLALAVQHIDADRRLAPARIDQDHSVRAGVGETLQQIVDEVALAVDNATTTGGAAVLVREGVEQDRLTRTRLAGDVDVMALLDLREAHRTPLLVLGEEEDLAARIAKVCRNDPNRSGAEVLAQHRKVVEMGQLLGDK